MKGVVIYGTIYGSTKKYAEELAANLGFDCVISKEFSKETALRYDIFIHGGGLYAGGLAGLKKTLSSLQSILTPKLLIFTVGLADPQNTENIKNIRESLKKQLPASLYNNELMFHLRGGIDYSKLTITHKTMMTLLNKKTSKIPLEERNEEVKAMIETFGQKVEFINLDDLKPIIETVQRLI